MRFFAYRLPNMELLSGSVQLQDVVLSRGENRAGELRAVLNRESAFRLVHDESTGEMVPLIRDKGTLLVADNGIVARSFIVDMTAPDAEHADRLQLSAVGFGDLPREEPWRGPAYKGIQVDPLEVYRHAWAYVTSFDDVPNVTVDPTTTPRSEWIGKEERRVEFTTSAGEDVAFDSGPYRLNWWTVDDIKGELDKLVTGTPFEWAEETRFNRDDDSPPRLHIRLGYPRLQGARREGIKLTVGVNVSEPETPAETDFFSECFVLGAGEGSDKVRGDAVRKHHGRMRRTKVISDTSIRSRAEASKRATDECARADREAQFIQSCRVNNHPAARPGTYDVGDIVTLTGLMPWGRIEQDCRIVELEHRLTDDSFKLTFARAS